MSRYERVPDSLGRRLGRRLSRRSARSASSTPHETRSISCDAECSLLTCSGSTNSFITTSGVGPSATTNTRGIATPFPIALRDCQIPTIARAICALWTNWSQTAENFVGPGGSPPEQLAQCRFVEHGHAQALGLLQL